jgi:hypothetical protein
VPNSDPPRVEDRARARFAVAGEWISRIEDVTQLVKRIDALRKQGDFEHAGRLLPEERVYGSR